MKKQLNITDYSKYSDSELLKELEKKTGYRFEDEELSLDNSIKSVLGKSGKMAQIADLYFYSYYSDSCKINQMQIINRIRPLLYLSKIKRHYCSVVFLNKKYNTVAIQPIKETFSDDVEALSRTIDRMALKYKAHFVILTRVSRKGSWKDCFEYACKLNIAVKKVIFLDYILATPDALYSAESPLFGVKPE